MRNEFAWYLNTTSTAAREAWDKAILTVDTNVLLDLYRYHTTTCEDILSALETFDGRVWLSHQAATEFFRNRRKVVASSEKTFKEAATGLDDLDKALDGGLSRLRSHQLIPKTILEDLSSSVSGAVGRARESLSRVTADYPRYLENDPVLERLLKLFDGRVGSAPSEERMRELLAEGRTRHEARIPPGYLDNKDGDRSYGDYVLWSEVMEFAKGAGAPIIMVTSERHEDWWLKVSGKTLSPRQELIEEFWRATNLPIFLYHTENFFRVANEHAGRKVNEEAVDDIKGLEVRRAHGRGGNSPAAIVAQGVFAAREDANRGVLEIDLQREVQNLTSSGRFDPELVVVPEVTVSMLSAPEGCPPLRVTAKTGTTFDFNIHLRPQTWGSTLPVGRYQVAYAAVCSVGDEFSTDAAPEPAV